MPWPTDWPPDAKAGTKFVAEVMKRFGHRIVLAVTLEEVRQALEDPDPTAELLIDVGPAKPSPSKELYPAAKKKRRR